MIRSNFHTHTTLCDGKNTPEEMVLQAIALGFEQLGFSGHMDADVHMDFAAYTAEIERLKEKYKGQIDILRGVELDNLYDSSLAEGAEYVIGSTHFLNVPSKIPTSVDNTPEMLVSLCQEFYGGDYYKLARDYFETEGRITEHFRPTFIGHFDLVTRFNDDLHFIDETDPRYVKPALEAMEQLVREGIPFEINCGAVNRGRKREFYPNHMLLKSLHDFGGEIFINSDAHNKELLDGAFENAVQEAINCGFKEYCILRHSESGSVEMVRMPLR